MRIAPHTRLLGLALAFSLVAAACGGGGAGGDGATSDGGAADGELVVTGSSTVEPISVANAEKFQEARGGVAITVDGPGTGDGFQRFCAGQADVTGASRPIKEAEAELCASNGVEYVELKIGIDGISILTNPANDAVECVDFAALYALTGPESQGFSTWQEAAPLAEELGSSHPEQFPDAPLDVVGPGEESGTYDSYVELVIEEFEDRLEEQQLEAATRPDYQASANDNVIVQGIQGSDTSLGWVGYAFYLENQDSVKALEVDNGETGCVPATDDTIASGEYPLSRPLFIYVNTQRAAENPVVREYVDFYLSEDGRESVSEVGYVQLNDEEWSNSQATWESAAGA